MATRSVPAHVAKSRVIDFFKQSEGHSAQPLGKTLGRKIPQRRDFANKLARKPQNGQWVHKKYPRGG